MNFVATLDILEADLRQSDHADAVVALIDAYSRDPNANGHGLSGDVKPAVNLVEVGTAHPLFETFSYGVFGRFDVTLGGVDFFQKQLFVHGILGAAIEATPTIVHRGRPIFPKTYGPQGNQPLSFMIWTTRPVHTL